MTSKRRPKPWREDRRHGTRYVWRFEDQRYWTVFYDDPEEAHADAVAQITEQLAAPGGIGRGRESCWRTGSTYGSGCSATSSRPRGQVQVPGRGAYPAGVPGTKIGSLTFEEIEAWERAIPRGRAPGGDRTLAPSRTARVAADHHPWRRRPRRQARPEPGRAAQGPSRPGPRQGPGASRCRPQTTANVITPLQALCLAERCALLSGRDIDFVMNVFAAWTGVRWGELLAVEGWEGKDSPLQPREQGSPPTPWTGNCANSAEWSANHRPRTARTAFSTCLRSWPT